MLHMTRSEEADSLAQDLELLGSGTLSAEGFRARYKSSQSAVATAVWPYVEHFLADDDIRARDDEYRTMQETELAKLVSLLRAGAPESELRQITFLGYSQSPNAA
ncbi:hypothetical protein AYO49_03585 [Verrucomicrobiaceae bacterium SCGC AG-212-N21]|nr:hypothetical protein AYO49_03585 [Verrucomicrobiaceae bacterium SCGC AG-212-N21]